MSYWALTWPPYGWTSFQASVSRIWRFHPYWTFALASNFPPQSAYLESLKILNTVIYAGRCWPERRYAARDCTHIYRLQQAYMPHFSWVQHLMQFSANQRYNSKICDCRIGILLLTESLTSQKRWHSIKKPLSLKTSQFQVRTSELCKLSLYQWSLFKSWSTTPQTLKEHVNVLELLKPFMHRELTLYESFRNSDQ